MGTRDLPTLRPALTERNVPLSVAELLYEIRAFIDVSTCNVVSIFSMVWVITRLKHLGISVMKFGFSELVTQCRKAKY